MNAEDEMKNTLFYYDVYCIVCDVLIQLENKQFFVSTSVDNMKIFV